MELHAFANGEQPFFTVFRVYLPRSGQAWNQLARACTDIGFPCDQWVIECVTSELISTRTAIGLSCGERNICHRNAVTGNCLGLQAGL